MKKLLKGELISLKVRVIGSRNESNIGISGKIIDETRHTLTVEENNERKKLIKDENEFEFPEKKIRVEGKLLLGRSEERPKKTKNLIK